MTFATNIVQKMSIVTSYNLVVFKTHQSGCVIMNRSPVWTMDIPYRIVGIVPFQDKVFQCGYPIGILAHFVLQILKNPVRFIVCHISQEIT